eukprot:TRINITY_DN17634_c0_g1_i1.p1 TRINITY_DN17634_c0_g1~~TRINITY_DN17634_c0_g1_i1.p1  ORF type:complete len:415 (-),score=74.06 TRINITY_DN17634_c0_g1_i1:81-1325(-)
MKDPSSSRGLRLGVQDDDERSSHTEDGRKEKVTLKSILSSTAFTILSTTCIGIALFGHSLVNVLGIPDAPGNVFLDVIMCAVTLFFIAEMAMSIIALPAYSGSFFFWMDLIGTCSMVFEISFLAGSAGSYKVVSLSNNATLTRTARAARLGTRAARFLRIMKATAMVTGGKEELQEELNVEEIGESKRISEKLALRLSEKVSLLTILMVCVLPLLQMDQYPVEDYSMKGWAERLEMTYSVEYTIEKDGGEMQPEVQTFAQAVDAMKLFYKALNYFPLSLKGFPVHPEVAGRTLNIPGEDEISLDWPVRKEYIVRVVVPHCHVQRPDCTGGDLDKTNVHQSYRERLEEEESYKRPILYFNFEDVSRRAGITDIFTIALVLFVMIFFSADVTKSLRGILFAPLPGYVPSDEEDGEE